jgi:hypothetical protein
LMDEPSKVEILGQGRHDSIVPQVCDLARTEGLDRRSEMREPRDLLVHPRISPMNVVK